MKAAMSEPEIVTRKGKPVSAIIPIKDYEELLERVEDTDDVAWLKRARRKPLHYRPLEDYLAERNRKRPCPTMKQLVEGSHIPERGFIKYFPKATLRAFTAFLGSGTERENWSPSHRNSSDWVCRTGIHKTRDSRYRDSASTTASKAGLGLPSRSNNSG